jgi:hypothetical protein
MSLDNEVQQASGERPAHPNRHRAVRCIGQHRADRLDISSSDEAIPVGICFSAPCAQTTHRSLRPGWPRSDRLALRATTTELDPQHRPRDAGDKWKVLEPASSAMLSLQPEFAVALSISQKPLGAASPFLRSEARVCSWRVRGPGSSSKRRRSTSCSS